MDCPFLSLFCSLPQLPENEESEHTAPRAIPNRPPQVRRSFSSDTVDSGFADPSRWSRTSIPQFISFDADSPEHPLRASSAEAPSPHRLKELKENEEGEGADEEEEENNEPEEGMTEEPASKKSIDSDNISSVESSRNSSLASTGHPATSEGHEADESCPSDGDLKAERLEMAAKRTRRDASARSPDPQKLDMADSPVQVSILPAESDDSDPPKDNDDTVFLSHPESSSSKDGMPTEAAFATKEPALATAGLSQEALDAISSRFESMLKSQVQELQAWWTEEMKAKAVGRSDNYSKLSRQRSSLQRMNSMDLGTEEGGGERRPSFTPSVPGHRSLSTPGMSLPKTVNVHGKIRQVTKNWLSARRASSRLRSTSIDISEEDGKTAEDSSGLSPHINRKKVERQPSVEFKLVQKPVPQVVPPPSSDDDSDRSSRSGSDEE